MSKIPQGEWNAIAARYAQGESISRIAQSYGCTPPAIHYILKRNRQRAAPHTNQPLNGRPQPPASSGETGLNRAAAEIPRAMGPRGEGQGLSRLALGEIRASSGQPAEPPAGHDREPALLGPTQDLQKQPLMAQLQSGNPQSTGRASAFTAGLDRDLHGRAEAAIEAFRVSFDAALAEGSPSVRQRLRQAASDLMRVAARTTIVLDRLNASAEGASPRIQENLRSGGAR